MRHLLGSLILLSFVLVSLSAACSSPPPTLTPTLVPASPTAFPPTQTATAAADRVSEEGYRVEISVTGSDGRAGISTFLALTTPVQISFRPMKDVVTIRRDGSSSKYSTDWKPNTVSEMRYCAGLGRTCTLPDKWVPFAAQQTVKVEVNWLGEKDWGVAAQFRDAAGSVIPAGYRTDMGSAYIVISSRIDESVPVTSLPAAAQTVVAQVRQAYPVTGSVKINDGRMMGGKAGSTIQIPVVFSASSPAGAVTEMRMKQDPTGRCLTPEEMNDATWQPFTEKVTFPYRLAINWTTFKLHVQYRDAKGNISTVYCADIGVEGSP